MLQQAVSESKRNHLFPVWSFCLMLAVVRCELSLSCQNTCTFSMLLLFCYRLFYLQKVIQLAISFSPFQVWSWCFITGKKKKEEREAADVHLFVGFPSVLADHLHYLVHVIVNEAQS